MNSGGGEVAYGLRARGGFRRRRLQKGDFSVAQGKAEENFRPAFAIGARHRELEVTPLAAILRLCEAR